MPGSHPCVGYSYKLGQLVRVQLLRKVLVRFAATMGSAAPTAFPSVVAEEAVVRELERRVFGWTWMSLVRKDVGESVVSGIVSGATVAAEKVAWLEGRRVRKWWVGWVAIAIGWVWVGSGGMSGGMGCGCVLGWEMFRSFGLDSSFFRFSLSEDRRLDCLIESQKRSSSVYVSFGLSIGWGVELVTRDGMHRQAKMICNT
jgi:hypothetical protein